MATRVSILGCGRTGIQTAVYLLDQFSGEVIVYDDDSSYVQGMALDCMQAAAVEGYCGSVKAAKTTKQLNSANILVICEQRDESLSKKWEKIARDFNGLCIYAGQDFLAFKKFASKIPSKSKHLYFSIHGVVDADILATEVAKKLDISIKDVQALVSGSIGAKVQTKDEWVRAGGIPVNEIKKNTVSASLIATQKRHLAFKKAPWKLYYAFAAAAAKTIVRITSARATVLSISTEKGSIPARVSEKGYEGVITK